VNYIINYIKKEYDDGVLVAQLPINQNKDTERFEIGGAERANEYINNVNYIINYIKKEYDDGVLVAQSLEKKKRIDFEDRMPKLTRSTLENADEAKLENEMFNMIFKQDIADFNKRKMEYQRNMIKAYALLWERCTKSMKHKIEARRNFEMDINDDPNELLKAIQEHSINFEDRKYDMEIIHTALKNLINLHMREDENVVDYSQQFKAAKEVAETQLGTPIVFGKCLDHDEELQAEFTTIYEEQIMNENTPQEETTSQRITRSKTKTNKDDIIQDNELTTYTSRRDQAEARARDRAWDRFLAYVYLSNSYALWLCTQEKRIPNRY
jgi:uncharacterized protein YqgQ